MPLSINIGSSSKRVRTNSLCSANCDFDSWQRHEGSRILARRRDLCQVAGQLSDRKFDRTSPELRANILEFYSDLSVAIETKKDDVRWQSVLKSLDQLKAAPPNAIVAGDVTQRPALVPTTEVARTHQRLIVDGVSDPIVPAKRVSETQQ